MWPRRKKVQPKEWGESGVQICVTEQSPDECEARQLTRQKMVGWTIPYDLYPTLLDYAYPSEERGPGMIEMVAIYVGREMLTSGILCSEVFSKEERRQFCREELLSLYRDEQGVLHGDFTIIGNIYEQPENPT